MARKLSERSDCFSYSPIIVVAYITCQIITPCTTSGQKPEPGWAESTPGPGVLKVQNAQGWKFNRGVQYLNLPVNSYHTVMLICIRWKVILYSDLLSKRCACNRWVTTSRRRRNCIENKMPCYRREYRAMRLKISVGIEVFSGTCGRGILRTRKLKIRTAHRDYGASGLAHPQHRLAGRYRYC